MFMLVKNHRDFNLIAKLFMLIRRCNAMIPVESKMILFLFVIAFFN